MNRNSKSLMSLAAAGLMLAACAAAPAAPAAPAKQVKVALVMPSASNDGAFSQSMFDALKAVQA